MCDNNIYQDNYLIYEFPDEELGSIPIMISYKEVINEIKNINEQYNINNVTNKYYFKAEINMVPKAKIIINPIAATTSYKEYKYD
ncbi:MAG: hypothetical protein UDQ58_03640 [Desulfovibrio sp.]|nr:hypothetical protein [Desulfovibrio sp.]